MHELHSKIDQVDRGMSTEEMESLSLSLPSLSLHSLMVKGRRHVLGRI